MNKVTLQISLAPSDYKHVIHLLEHQIKTFYNQVDEILLTYDTHRSKGRFGHNWQSNNQHLRSYLNQYENTIDKIRLIEIDYSENKKKEIGKKYFNKNSVPAKDWRGGPFYTYFFGLNEAKHDFVFHIDSDIFFGGGSQSWIKEALELYVADTRIIFISPLPGPAREDGKLIKQNYRSYKSKEYHYEFDHMSTRLFLTNRKRLLSDGLTIKNFYTLKIKELARAIYKKNPPYRLPEEILSDFLKNNSKIRVDFLGSNVGVWSLHPPYRSEKFYLELPELIKRVENNEVPLSQQGFYDIVDELFDWTEAKSKLKA